MPILFTPKNTKRRSATVNSRKRRGWRGKPAPYSKYPLPTMVRGEEQPSSCRGGSESHSRPT